MNIARFGAAALGLGLLTSCKDAPSGPPPKASMVEVNPVARSVPANTVISPNVVVKLTDASGNAIVGQTVTFSIAMGGGTLTGSASAMTDAQGQATAPVWRVGKSANGNGGQVLRVRSGTLDSLDIAATAASSFNIVVRFYDDNAMTAAQKELFTLAAQRIMGIVTGDEALVTLSDTDISSCLDKSANTTKLTEQIDDLVIYATVKAIDGPGNVVGSAGPCFVRVPGHTPILGQLVFDAADFGTFATAALDIITHEMLHVLGVGALWHAHNGQCGPPTCRDFVDSVGTTNPLYNAPEGRAGCVAVGGTTTCATRVPVEGCLGIASCAPKPSDPSFGEGTRDSHWRESTFGAELMTGFFTSSTSQHPISSMTIGALKDLGYVVNASGNDDYTMSGSVAASSLRALGPQSVTMVPGWERLNTRPLYSVDRTGNVRLLRKAK